MERVYALRTEIVLVIVCMLCCPAQLWASDEVAAAGLELATKVHYRPRGKDQASFTIMTLSGSGEQRRRELYQYRFDGDNRGDTATMIRFVNPPDIAGTGLLTLDHADKGDSDQWVYLPALGRERRISSRRKGGRFVGSDMYFEDLRDRDPGKDSHEILGVTELNGKPHILLESIPKDPDNSVYSKRIGWIDPESYAPMRLDYFVEGKSQPVKRWLVNEARLVDGYWLTIDRVMVDIEKGTSTRLYDERVKSDQGMDAALFDLRVLKDDSMQLERKWHP